ncbi:MAG: hypothetical protein NXI31_15960 [bacterium]|nr:hypothetical protein [bacterium]
MRALLVVAFAVGGPALSQTFIVDAANGPGTNFLDLPPAVAAAPSGAILEVRPGSYTGFTMSGKGLTILGGPGVRVTGVVSVSNTSPLQPTTVRGLQWTTAQLTALGGLLTLANCAGAVTLSEISQPPNTGSAFRFSIGLWASSCSQLHVRDCSILAAASLVNCHTVIESSRIQGEDHTWGPVWPGRTALALTGGETQLCGGSVLQGGHGRYGGLVTAPAGSGVTVNSAEFRAIDGWILAGAGGPLTPLAVRTTGVSQVRLGTRVGLAGAYGPNRGTLVMPGLTGTDAPSGGPLRASVQTEAGDLVILVLGLPGPTSMLLGLQDPFWIDPALHLFAAIGLQSATGPVSASVPVPSSVSFRGTRLNWGAVCQGPLTGFQVTNPVVTTVY